MGRIQNNIETGFLIKEREWNKLYGIYDSLDTLCGIVWYKINIDKKTTMTQISIEYDLQIISGRNFKQQELQMISFYYHNLVRTLTDDMQTIFSNNIEERFQLPFTSNILHIKKLWKDKIWFI